MNFVVLQILEPIFLECTESELVLPKIETILLPDIRSLEPLASHCSAGIYRKRKSNSQITIRDAQTNEVIAILSYQGLIKEHLTRAEKLCQTVPQYFKGINFSFLEQI